MDAVHYLHTNIADMPALMSADLDIEHVRSTRRSKGQDLRSDDGVHRVSNGVQALLKAGDVEAHQVEAAERWYKDYVLGVIGARDPDRKRSGGAADIHTAMLARTAACGRCRIVRTALGLCSEIRLKLLLIDELSFSAIAAKLRPGDVNGRKKIAAQMALLLEQLSEVYAQIDQQRKARAR
jgi:hypothetical protein